VRDTGALPHQLGCDISLHEKRWMSRRGRDRAPCLLCQCHHMQQPPHRIPPLQEPVSPWPPKGPIMALRQSAASSHIVNCWMDGLLGGWKYFTDVPCSTKHSWHNSTAQHSTAQHSTAQHGGHCNRHGLVARHLAHTSVQLSWSSTSSVFSNTSSISPPAPPCASHCSISFHVKSSGSSTSCSGNQSGSQKQHSRDTCNHRLFHIVLFAGLSATACPRGEDVGWHPVPRFQYGTVKTRLPRRLFQLHVLALKH
jgi:hypothetical protein